jgi:hypothetical protein
VSALKINQYELKWPREDSCEWQDKILGQLTPAYEFCLFLRPFISYFSVNMRAFEQHASF